MSMNGNLTVLVADTTSGRDQERIQVSLSVQGIRNVVFARPEQTYSVFVQALQNSSAMWVLHMRSCDTVHPNMAYAIQAATAEMLQGNGLNAASILSLPVNSTATIEEGYRIASNLFERLMKWGTPSINFCTGVFDRMCAEQMWAWADRLNILHRFEDHHLEATELLLWLSVYTRIGYAYGIADTICTPGSPVFNHEVLDEVRNLYIRKWLGFRVMP